jgi:hypothetical protein
MDNQVIDRYHGQGGSYVVDPQTGKRELVHRTQHEADAIAGERVLGSAKEEAPSAPVVPILNKARKRA